MAKSIIDSFSVEKLSVDAEAALLQRGGEASLTKLVMANMREALLYTGKCCNSRIPDDERASLCYQELQMCAKRFDPTRGRFFPFCKAALRGRMKRSWTLRNTVRNAAEVVSLDAPVKADKPIRSEGMTGNESNSDDLHANMREQVTGEIVQPETGLIESRDKWAVVDKLLAGKLDDRERAIVILHYKEGLNFSEIGKLFGFTRSLIQRIHRDCLQKMRDAVAADGRLLEEHD